MSLRNAYLLSLPYLTARLPIAEGFGNLPALCKEHEIVIAAVGKAKLVKSDWLMDDAVVIDVGVNRSEDNKLCGDVDFNECLDKVKYITPVPRCVGPMTIAMLMSNTVELFEKSM